MRSLRVGAVVLATLMWMTASASAAPFTWSEEQTLNPSSTAAPIWAVDCPSTTQCTASDTGGNIVTFDPYTGISPTGVHNVHPASGQQLTGISCPSTTQCTVVNNVDEEVTFDPTSASPNNVAHSVNGFIPEVTGTPKLYWVDCPSTTQCTGLDRRGQEVTFDPTSSTPNQIPHRIDNLAATGYAMGGLACPSVTQCTAVDTLGYAVTFDPQSSTPSEVLHLINERPAPEIAYSFVALACPSTSQCTAVDNAGNHVTFNPVTWAYARRQLSTDNKQFNGLSCPSTTQCTATYHISGVSTGTLTFDPTSATPNTVGQEFLPDDLGGTLGAIACPAVSACEAITMGRSGFFGRDVTGLTVPTLSSSAPSAGIAGTAIAATAVSGVLAGGSAPTKAITFKAYGPQETAPTSCRSAVFVVGSSTVSGNGTYHPPVAFTPAKGGTYWWYASYSGDQGNAPAASTCGTAMAKTVVSPRLTATGPAGGALNTAINAANISSVVSGAVGATGTITFKVFGPQSSAPGSCTGGTTVGTATVNGNGAYHPSGGFTPTQAGNYWWYASYSGGGTQPAGTSPCGDLMGKTVIAAAAPNLSAGGPDKGVAGEPVSARLTAGLLTGGETPTGTITFFLIGPQASVPTSCAGQRVIGTAVVTDVGVYNPPADFTVPTAGTYWYYATYDGDANNAPATSECGEGSQMSKLLIAPRLDIGVPSPANAGEPLPLTATFSGGNAPTGTISFLVFGPQDDPPHRCGDDPTIIGNATVTGNGTYHPNAQFTPTATGTYWWVWTYSGDANNAALGVCDLWTDVLSTTVVKKAATPPDTTPPDTTPPATTSPSTSTGGLTPTPIGPTFGDKIAPQFTSKVAAKAGKRTKGRRVVTLRFALSEDATVKLTLTRSASGFRSGSKCVKPPRRIPAKAKRCTRQAAAGTKSTRLKAGARTLATARLTAGTYRASVVATDAAGNRSEAVTVSFRVT